MIVWHAFNLALHSLRFSWKRNALLAFVLGVSLGLPLLLNAMLVQASMEMRARTALAPLLLGAKGSESDLVFGAMFFATRPPSGLVMSDLSRVESERLASAIPIVLGATAHKKQVVGTTIDYFRQRSLVAREGALFATIGECVLGARCATELSAAIGSTFFTDPAELANLAGVFPLELRVTGILPATGTPDDDAIFVDVRTMWSIQGLGHRHESPSESSATGAVLATTADSTGTRAIAGEALPIDRDLAASTAPSIAPTFHFHGVQSEFPIDAALVFPDDSKARSILLGRFGSRGEPLQLIRPDSFADRVLNRIFGVGKVLASIAYATAALVALVVAGAFMLSMRLRADELALMRRLGASRGRVALFIATEAMILACAAGALAILLARLAPALSSVVLRFVAGD